MEKIDAVITWVDGSEPNFKLKLEENLKNKKIIKRQYIQANEIDFCVASIIKFAPFVRKIFIVTDKQKPNFSVIRHLVSLKKIEIIDHEEIFRDNLDCMPSFNIRSIDALLFKIRNLSDKFIYFNDDMFLVKETSKEDWFKDKMDNFKYYGRDMETLFSKVKISHSRRVFCKPKYQKTIITKKDMNSGFKKYLENGGENDKKDDNEAIKTMYM